MGPDGQKSPSAPVVGAPPEPGKGPGFRPLKTVTDPDAWRERTRHMWALMPDHIRDRVIDELIQNNPRVVWMTIIGLLDRQQCREQLPESP